MPHPVGLLVGSLAVAAIGAGPVAATNTMTPESTSSHCAISGHHRHCHQPARDEAGADLQTEEEAVVIATAVLVTALAAL